MKRKPLWLLAIGVVWPAVALAQDGARSDAAEDEAGIILPLLVYREDEITVLATGQREPLAFSGEAVSIFTRDDIDEVQGADIARLLERAPGVTLSRNGGPGNFTGVRVRGAEGEQLLVLIDGVRVADAAAPAGGFDFGNLLMGNLAKVELQRSSNSTIWGSQALGGVLAATTAGDSGRFAASAEYGAYDTFYATGSLGLDLGAGALSLRAAHFDSDGFSSAAAGSEPDGFRQSELVGRLRIDVGADLVAFASGRLADGRLELDGFPGPTFTLSDTAEYQDTRQFSGAVGLDYRTEALDLRGAISLADTHRENFDPALGPAPGFTADGESKRAEWRGRWRFGNDWALDFGAEREWSRFSTLFDAAHRTAITGAYAQLDHDDGPLHISAGLRRDEHRDFGSEWSLGADAAYQLSASWRLTASFGEGFKAPTLFQLHSDFGNGRLTPERSRSYDLGIAYDYNFARFALTAFRRDTDSLIVFVACPVQTGICAGRPLGTYDNVGRARAQGLELEGDLKLPGGLTAGAVYTLLDAEDRSVGSANAGNELPRRAEHTLTAMLDWQTRKRLVLGADLRVASESFDDAANLVPLGGYEILTLRASYQAGEHVTLFGRVENVWNEEYQTAAGYATAGRGAYLGARARL